MRKRMSDRLREVTKLVGEVPDGFIEDALGFDIRHETHEDVHAEATDKTTRRAPR
ncbi:MAG: hypothetical protein ACETWO_04500 [Candidatus Hadarchaeaceae archaeon]